MMPLDWCVSHLGIYPGDWISPPKSPPQFGQPSRLDAYASPRHVVVEVAEEDLPHPRTGWRAGFYRARLSVQQAREKLKLK